MSFEHDPLRQAHSERSPDQHEVIVATYQQAEKVLNDAAFDLDDFSDFYQEDEIAADKVTVTKAKERFVNEGAKKCATVLEAITFEHIEMSNWLGEGVITHKTSDYDDIVNGVDLVAEITLPNQYHLAMGVDITFSKSVTDNFERIRNEIQGDKLGVVKYFDSSSVRGTLKNIPRAIINVDASTVIELAYLWKDKKNAELALHPIQHLILDELEHQFRVYMNYAEHVGSTNAHKVYRSALGVVRGIRDRKYAQGDHNQHNEVLLKRIDSQLEIFGA